LHTLGLIARQPWRHCVTSLRSAHWLASHLKLAAHCPVSGCWPSCYFWGLLTLSLFWRNQSRSTTVRVHQTDRHMNRDKLSL